jgi:ADP-ribose pyrophosphatase
VTDPDEDPEATAIRELFEETGYRTKTIELVGKSATCAGRISNATHSYFVHTADRDANFVEEPGVTVSSATWNELSAMILSGEFNEQTHLGVLTLAAVRGLISF